MSTIEGGVTRSAPFIPASHRAAKLQMKRIGLTVAAGALLAILGPFGSYMNRGPVWLLGYWIGAMLLGLFLYGSAYKLVGTLTARGSQRWWLALLGATLLASVPEALATRAVAFLLWPELKQLDLPLPRWFAQTATIGLIGMTCIGFARHHSASGSSNDISPQPLSQPMVTSLGGDVLALQMEDHYVRVHRSTGSELILMPLSRAIESMQVEGMQTHRSWWVASHAVVTVHGNARSMRLLLSNDVTAPVARSAVARLKDAGWIAKV